MRRALAGMAAVALLLVTAEPASAAPEDWEGSAIITTATTNPEPTLRAMFTRTSWPRNHRVLVDTAVASPVGQPPGCTPPAANPPTTVANEGGAYVASAPIATTCNGAYSVTFTANLQTRDCFIDFCSEWRTADTHALSGTTAVAAPAPPVDARTEAGDGRSVVVRWDAVTDPPPDFLGFRVERRSGDGDWALVKSIDDPASATTSATDASPPVNGGDIEYRVLTRRSGPGGEVVNSTGASDTAAVEPAPGAPDPQEPGGGGPTGPGDPTSPGQPGTPGGDGAEGGGTGGDGRGRPSRGRIQAPRLGITGTFLPPLLQPRISPVQGGAATPTTIDDGFDEELPYDPQEVDEEPSSDEEATMVLGTEVPGRGLAVPIATGLVLAVWAFHLRFLARASRPV